MAYRKRHSRFEDFLTVEENNRLENSSEETVNNYWAKATKIAEEVLK
jgi:hypothetical protein